MSRPELPPKRHRSCKSVGLYTLLLSLFFFFLVRDVIIRVHNVRTLDGGPIHFDYFSRYHTHSEGLFRANRCVRIVHVTICINKFSLHYKSRNKYTTLCFTYFYIRYTTQYMFRGVKNDYFGNHYDY